ncbi:glycine betaine/proline transport system permease protein/glycine betaine/proline transport system substrate-binding protein [Terribacillus halophilus]|uniref:Glycine betaine/proline transport system permease protein/glycine betaine/proline transport system substrate-binding protein n=1 Tax=Terribacillus halophilus TaxID=361279 RepID=A0A1G6P9U2_9BACI|nr:proline/glycine betaine ABC transporter permease [Terribacillus halophilus]SDC77002.1 glycine betaine/proline transport system permease protein/glycine betaine/proline transport system substrate-binding protein [Terribacillus halophilus]
MLDFMENVKEIPVGDWMTDFVDWLTNTFAFLFDPIKDGLASFMSIITQGLAAIPPVIFILLVAILAFFMTGKKFGLAVFSIIGLLFIWNQGLWDHLIETFTLVLIASIICIIIGIPIGILMAKSKVAETIITPILDFMQTMPAFVYLIPAVAFFSIGVVPGIFASLIFATPPTVRFTNLGIRQVSDELVEAADAFGSTGPQKLFKVELPMAKYTIMAGVNQTVMLALSMVVIASMIGAPGLGREVLASLQRAQVGPGFVAGLCIFVLAIIIDRFTQNIYKDKSK